MEVRDDYKEHELVKNIRKLHTTVLGTERIRRNLSLEVEDVISWCREKILDPKAIRSRRGKNWYVVLDHFEITVNAYSYTVITAHKI